MCAFVCTQRIIENRRDTNDVKERWREGSPEVDNCWVCGARGNQRRPVSPIHAYLNAFGAEAPEGARQTKRLIFHRLACWCHTHRSLCWSLFVSSATILLMSHSLLDFFIPSHSSKWPLQMISFPSRVSVEAFGAAGLSQTGFYYIFTVNMMILFSGWKSGLKPTKACDLKMPQVDTRWKNTQSNLCFWEATVFLWSKVHVCGFGGWAKGHLRQQVVQSILSMASSPHGASMLRIWLVDEPK